MRRVNKLKVLTVILMAILVVCSAKMTLAATSITSISSSTGNAADNNTVNNIATNNVVENNTANNTVNNVVANTSYNNVTTNTSLPDTGAKSTIGLIALIGLTSVSAVYTYRKVKKYNI